MKEFMGIMVIFVVVVTTLILLLVFINHRSVKNGQPTLRELWFVDYYSQPQNPAVRVSIATSTFVGMTIIISVIANMAILPIVNSGPDPCKIKSIKLTKSVKKEKWTIPTEEV